MAVFFRRVVPEELEVNWFMYVTKICKSQELVYHLTAFMYEDYTWMKLDIVLVLSRRKHREETPVINLVLQWPPAHTARPGMKWLMFPVAVQR